MREFNIIQDKKREDRQDIIWYNGVLAAISEGNWRGSLFVYGGIKVKIGEDIYVEKSGSNPKFIKDISKHIECDQDIYDLIEKDLIDFYENSWFEVMFENTTTNEDISDVLDAGSYDDAIEAFKEYFEYLLEQKNG